MEYQLQKAYILDRDTDKAQEVILVFIYGKTWCRVKDPEEGVEDDVMLSRLSDPQAKAKAAKGKWWKEILRSVLPTLLIEAGRRLINKKT